MAAGILPICSDCLNLRGIAAGKGWVCTAFPDGISTDILASKADHHKPFKGDHGVRYTPLIDTATVIDLLHPGARVSLARLGMDETQVARAMAAGEIASPHKFENAWLIKLRITGTGTAYRQALDEHVVRPPEHYISDHFLARCNGLPVILEHPPGQMLNAQEFTDRNVGAVVFPFIEGDEVWGIARIFDDQTAQYLIDHPGEVSTSPAVVFRPLTSENETIGLADDKHILIEGKPILVDHLALCAAGVWDKQGPPSGVIIGDSGTAPEGSGGKAADTAVVNRGDGKVAEEKEEARERDDAHRDDMKRDDKMRDDKARDDAEGKTLDKILSHLDSMHKRFDAMDRRHDAMCERMDAMDSERKRDDSRKRDDWDEEEKKDSKRDDSEECSEEDRKDKRRADKKRKDEDPETEKRQAAELEKLANEERKEGEEEEKKSDRKRKDAKRDDADKDEDEDDRKDRRKDSRKRDDEDEGETAPMMAAKDRGKRDSKRDDRHRDDEDAEIEMRREEMKAEHPYPSGISMPRGDRMRDDRMRDDARADAQMVRDLRREIDEAHREIRSLKRTTRERTPQDRAAMADAQVRADAVYGVWGKQAPNWMQGEDLTDYRVRLLREMQQYSKDYKDADLNDVARIKVAFDIAEKSIYADAATYGRRPESVPNGFLRMSVRTDESGRTIREFHGSPRVWMQPWLQPVRCATRISYPPPQQH